MVLLLFYAVRGGCNCWVCGKNSVVITEVGNIKEYFPSLL